MDLTGLTGLLYKYRKYYCYYIIFYRQLVEITQKYYFNFVSFLYREKDICNINRNVSKNYANEKISELQDQRRIRCERPKTVVKNITNFKKYPTTYSVYSAE